MPEFFEPCKKAPWHWRLTQAQRELAESYPSCKIPISLAKKHRKGSEDRYERLLEFANICYVMNARSFKPEENPLGQEGWQPYAYYWTERHMLNMEVRYQRKNALLPLASLDALTLDGDGTVAETIPSRVNEQQRRESEDLCRKVMSLLKSNQKAAIRLHYVKGMTYKQIGAHLGLTRERARQLIIEGTATARKRLSHAKAVPNRFDVVRLSSIARIEAKRRRRCAIAQAQRSRASQAMGGIAKKGWYVACPREQRLVGPYSNQRTAWQAAAPGIKEEDVSRARVALRKQDASYAISSRRAYEIRRSLKWSVVFPSGA